MKRSILAFFFVLFTTGFALADTISINHFVVKENPFAKDEIAIVAVDTARKMLTAASLSR
jgi:hypothetical protein